MDNAFRLRNLESVLIRIAPEKQISIAYSGGLDSRSLAFLAKRLGFSVELLHVCGPHVPHPETQYAIKWAKEHGLELKVLNINPLQISALRLNPLDRCYSCKHFMFSELLKAALYRLCDGTNHSDLGTYRPGVKALKELGILSPLALAKISKDELRNLVKEFGMDNWEQMARPCILTRFPYNRAIDDKEIEAVICAEKLVSNFLDKKIFEDINFRIRKVSDQQFQVHFLEKDLNLLNQETQEELSHQLNQLDPLFKGITLMGLPKLSGFFDKT